MGEYATNAEKQLLANAARVATTPSAEQTFERGKGAMFFLFVDATPDNTETLQLIVEARDPDSPDTAPRYFPVATFPVTPDGTTQGADPNRVFAYTVYPGGIAETIAVADHEFQNLPLPRRWRARVVHSAGGSWTYSLACSVIPD